MKLSIVISTILLFLVAGCSDSGNGTPVDPNNTKPVIKSITFIPDTVIAGKSCLIICEVVDQENDKLEYFWESPGSIDGSGENVYFSPGSCCGAPIVTVTVKDSNGGKTDSSVTVPFKYK